MKNEFYFRIIKINKINRIGDFENLFIKLQKFNNIMEIKNYNYDFFHENNLKINNGIDRYHKVYHRKFPNNSVENFIIKCSINSNEFYKKNKVDSFAINLYKILNKYFDILYFICVPNATVYFEYYAFCIPTVKMIFQQHTLVNLKDKYREPKEMIGVLSFNLLLGGSKKENPLGNFYLKLLKELNDKGYNLSKGENSFLEEQYRKESLELQNINCNLEQDIYILMKELTKKYPNLQDDISKYITNLNLKYISFLK